VLGSEESPFAVCPSDRPTVFVCVEGDVASCVQGPTRSSSLGTHISRGEAWRKPIARFVSSR